MRFGAVLAALAACLSASPLAARVPVAPGQPLLATQFPARILAGHNRARQEVGLPPLAWDPALAQSAATYAAQMALSRQFVHSDRKSRPGVGENLWMGSRGRHTVEAMIGRWLAERRNFVPGVFPNTSRTRNWMDVSHYSQMIWPTTTRIGCAVAANAGTEYLVCRYSPKGNIDGRSVPHGNR